ncbi:hypothetical protein [Sodalis endosymbiont of Henestaris halophilus]|uniref:hypothetical protein n=1 Tax=Sodalis endosymbiont of Henestaris halophilus TaxID=1929246 RepID=UPI0012FE4E96|nr:hypothetical protein [Sodalis endosymbiont of Henestaris halophilus]
MLVEIGDNNILNLLVIDKSLNLAILIPPLFDLDKEKLSSRGGLFPTTTIGHILLMNTPYLAPERKNHAPMRSLGLLLRPGAGYAAVF